MIEVSKGQGIYSTGLLKLVLCAACAISSCSDSSRSQYSAVYIDKSFDMGEYYELDSSRYRTRINMHCRKKERMIFKDDDYEVMLSRSYTDTIHWSSGYEYVLIGIKISEPQRAMKAYYLSWRNSRSSVLPEGYYSWRIDESTVFVESNDSSKLKFALMQGCKGTRTFVKVDTISVSWDRSRLRLPLDSIITLKGYKRPVEKTHAWYLY